MTRSFVEPRRLEAVGVLLGVVLGCDAEPPPVASSIERCPEENQAPLRNGPGAARPFDCVTVGATTALTGGEWPAVDALPAPRVYVSPAASPGGDGTLARPFDTLASAVSALATGGGTIALARGTHDLRATLSLPPGVTLVGAGAGITMLLATGGRAAVELSAGTGGVRGLTIRFDAGAAVDADVGIAARAGATLTLDDVRIERAAVGVLADGATVVGTRVTALRPAFAGVRLEAGARGVFSLLWVHHSVNYGVRATDAVIHLTDSMITCNGISGLTVSGAPPPMGGAASCAGDLRAPSGDTMCWRRVAFIENASQGIDVAVCRANSAECRDRTGRIVVEARLLSVSRTQTRECDRGRCGGDGVSVGPHVRLSFDPEVVTAAGRGSGTAVVSNARAGLLVQGPDAVIALDGARVAGNGGPGVFLQAAARAERIGHVVVEGNSGLGVGVTPSSTVGVMVDNRFVDTHVGSLVLSSGETVTFGDGLALAQRVDLRMTDNEFTGNERFAAFLTQVESATITGNYGDDNRFGLTAYASTVDLSANRVRAREAAPTAPPSPLSDAMMMAP